MTNLTNDNPFGVLFFRFSDLQELNVNRYFDCLGSIKPLLESPDFKNSTPGFYINYIRGSVRLTYFTNDEIKTKKAIQDFLNKNIDVILFPSNDSKENIRGNAASGDPEEELKFRLFSNIYTHIGLDLLGQDILPLFRSVLAEYMNKFFITSIYTFREFPPKEKLEGINSEIFFNSFFDKYSRFFREELNKSQREQLWSDLEYCHRRELCFPHFLANMFAVSDDGKKMI